MSDKQGDDTSVLDRVFPPAECDDVWAVKVLFPQQYGSWTNTPTPTPSPVTDGAA